MAEHPIIKLMALAIIKRDGEDPDYWKGNVPVSTAALTTALQWLSDPANLSDDVVDVASEILFNQYYAERYSYEPACFKIDAQTVFTAMINALIKEIEDHD